MEMLTMQEFESARIFELDNRVYNRIEAAFRKVLGNNAKRFLESHLEMKLKDLSSTSFVDVMGCFQII